MTNARGKDLVNCNDKDTRGTVSEDSIDTNRK